ncbi:MAG: hypothetical protein WDM78_07710 [Puia sp.]
MIGILKLTLQIFKTSLSGWASQFESINFLYFCIYLFLFSIVIMLVVSLLSAKPDEKQLQGLTFSTTVSADKKRADRAGTQPMSGYPS